MMATSSLDNPEVLPIQRFIRDLMRSKSFTESIPTKKETLQSNSAKSVMDFDKCVTSTSENNTDNENKTSNSNSNNNEAETKEVADTFDVNSLVLVSDNARVFANARPKQKSAPLTSASWHSSSELRKQYTAKSRWGGTPEASPLSAKNQPFALPTAGSRTSGRTVDRRSVTRRTSDSCLSVPTRSWMKPQHQRNLNSSLPQKPQRRRPNDNNISVPTQSWKNEPPQQPLRTRRTGMPVQPSRSVEGPPQPIQRSRVASPFAASPLEAALRNRRPMVQKQSSSDSLVSSEEFSVDSVRSFESFGSNDDWGEPGIPKNRLRARDSRQLLRARDSRQLISCNKTSTDTQASTNASWSPMVAHEPNPLLAKNNTKANDTQQRQIPMQLQQQHPRGGFAPIPPSLLLPYDRFQADAPASSSESLASAASRNPPLGRSRSSRSFRGNSRNNLQEGSSSSSRNNLHKGSSKNSMFPTSSSKNSMFPTSNHNLGSMGKSKSYHNHYSGSIGNFRSARSAQANEGLRSQSDHYSPMSTLELALGDMAPTRNRRHGVRRKKSNDTM